MWRLYTIITVTWAIYNLDIIRNKQGLVGGIPVRWFVKNKKENATLDDFIEILEYLKEKIGIEHIALGFDFMDYIPGMEDTLMWLVWRTSQKSKILH